MEDDGNDLENLFEEYEKDNENNVIENEGVANNNTDETETRERVPVPKRIIKNPRLKFNAERLVGERGIPVVVKHFKDVKFKGKGHEVEDLTKLMSTLEHWCHRLYPSMKFEDCLKQIEKLGKKRPVQTCLRKIRLDMPILSSDFIGDERDNEDEEIQNELLEDMELPQQDAFDRLISQTPTTSYEKLVSTPLPEKRLGTFGTTLTEEQKKRMEYNKLLATERRKAKLAAMESVELIDQSQENVSEPQASTSSYNIHENTISNELSSVQNISELVEPSEEDKSEELGLDDLVDLVDDDDDVSLVENVKNVQKSPQVSNFQADKPIEVVDITNIEDKNLTSYGCVAVVDLVTDNINTNSQNNQQIDVINLDYETGSSYESNLVTMETEEIHIISHEKVQSSEQVKMLDAVNVSNESLHGQVQVVDLETENSREENFPNSQQSEIIDLDHEAGASNKLHSVEIDPEKSNVQAMDVD